MKLAGLPCAAHGVDQLRRHVDFLARQLEVRKFAGWNPVVAGIDQFLGKTHQHQHQSIVVRHQHRQVLACTDHHLGDADASGFLQRFTQQHVGFVRLAIRRQQVGLVEIARIDRLAFDEGFQIDGLRGLRRRLLDGIRIDHRVAALLVFEGLDHVLPGDFPPGLGIHALVTDRAFVTRVEHAEMQIDAALARVQADRHMQQAEGDGSGPDRSGHVAPHSEKCRYLRSRARQHTVNAHGAATTLAPLH